MPSALSPIFQSSSRRMSLLRWICVIFGCFAISITSSGDAVSDQFKRMQPCPSSPNCASSTAVTGSHFIEPLIAIGDPQGLIAGIKTNLEEDPSFSIIESEPDYLRAEARTRFLGFVDDVEFQTRQDSIAVDMRSGSRVGYSDLGKNRRRLEALRKSLVKAEFASR